MTSQNRAESGTVPQDAAHREAAKDAGRKMGTGSDPQHLSADQPQLDSTDAASADSFPASDPPPSQSRIT